MTAGREPPAEGRAGVGGSEHDRWAELAVGFGLHALDPADAAAFVPHLRTCEVCSRDVAHTAALAADLAYAAEPVDLPPGLRRDLLSAASGDAAVNGRAVEEDRDSADADRAAGSSGESGYLTRLRPRAGSGAAAAPDATTAVRRGAGRWPWLTAVAAAAAVIAGGWGWVARSEERAVRQRVRAADAVVACVQQPDCRTVALLPAGGGGAATATAMVRGTAVTLLVDGLPRNDAASSTYVLWSRTSGGPMAPVGTFDVTSSTPRLVRPGRLPAALARPLLAVSIEPGRVAPARPTHPVAAGTVAG